MASSIASPICLGDGNSLEEFEIHIPKQTAIDKIGIFCHICNSIYGNKKDYDSHYAWHNTGASEIVYTCTVCRKQISTYSNFSRHCYLSHVAKNKFQCKHCSKKFIDLCVLNSHISAVHEHQCNSCKNKFTSKRDLAIHKKTIHAIDNSDEELEFHLPKQTAIDKIGGIFCHICNTTFGKKKDYDIHYGQHNTGASEIIYTCVVCKKQISSYPSFRGHCYINHVMKNKFPCDHCTKTFSKLCVLNSHISAVHDHKCLDCNDKFTSKRDLEIHKKIIHANDTGKNEPPYDCLLCNTVIKTVDACESHIDDHCEMLYPCPICKDVLPNKLAAIKHLTNHFDEKLPNIISAEPSHGEDCSIDILGGILCCLCNSLCRNRAEIDMHFKDQHEGKPVVYTCNVCRKPYDKYEMFGKHCYDHFARGKFQCDQCEKTFSRPSLLVIHMEAFHTDCSPEKPYGCERCGHGYMTSLRLQEHLKIVHKEEGSRSRCMKPGCSAIFEKPRDLIQHLKDHNPMLDNWCKQCGLQFTSLSSAEKHLDVHRHTQYSCPICKRTYGEKYFMVKHVPTHFEATLHICKTCGKGYSARNRLMHHLKSHSETRSHKCTFCSKSFLKPYELTQHLNIHTGHKPYPCTLCPKTFANYPNWSKHLSRVHFVDKTKIKQLNAELKKSVEAPKIKTSPTKPESGIESAGSELSDIYTFMDSDESTDDWAADSFNEKASGREVAAGGDLAGGEAMSITDTVNAVIDRIDSLDEDFDWTVNEINETNITPSCVTNSEFIAPDIAMETIDDMSEIKAIVEHIDAMSEGLETLNNVQPTDSVSELEEADPGILQYTDMTPVDNADFNTISGALEACLPVRYGCAPEYVPDPEYGPEPDYVPDPEYGPDPGAGLAGLDDHILPHIDPLLTIKTENNAKMYVQNLNTYNFDSVTAPIEYEARNDWAPPIITKVYKYEENNDVNNMYIIY